VLIFHSYESLKFDIEKTGQFARAVEVPGMYVIFIKEDGKHTVKGIVESIDEVKRIVKQNDMKDRIETGKAYLIEGEIKLIRPEVTPELLDLKVSKTEKDLYY
jgi:hypothetical protein